MGNSDSDGNGNSNSDNNSDDNGDDNGNSEATVLVSLHPHCSKEDATWRAP